MEEIIKEVLDRYKDGQANLRSNMLRSRLASEIKAVILDRVNAWVVEETSSPNIYDKSLIIEAEIKDIEENNES
mgnify:FL=1